MDPNNEYDDYSALDAPPHLQHVLEQFFSHTQNGYKYALAKKHFNDVIAQDTFIDAPRFSKYSLVQTSSPRNMSFITELLKVCDILLKKNTHSPNNVTLVLHVVRNKRHLRHPPLLL